MIALLFITPIFLGVQKYTTQQNRAGVDDAIRMISYRRPLVRPNARLTVKQRRLPVTKPQQAPASSPRAKLVLESTNQRDVAAHNNIAKQN